MKKINYLIIASIFFFVITVKVDAMTTESYNQTANEQKVLASNNQKLIELYNEQKFALGDVWFDSNGNLAPVQILSVKYIETSTYLNSDETQKNLSITRELTPEEYKNWEPDPSKGACPPGMYTDCWETTAKRVFIAVHTNPYTALSVINQWKTMPTVRSYDTIGVLYNSFIPSSATGTQWYNTSSNQNYQTINYSYGGDNMKISTSGQTGISVSQNIVDNVYNYLQNDLYVYGTFNTYWTLQATGSYQHAVNNISLATSKDFSFDPWGMGKVFNWNPSWSNWDSMQGVCVNNTNYLWAC